jgi:NitT/TauT family transport system substrate-binding protein
MSTSTSDDWRRRDFLARSIFAGAASLLGVTPTRVAAEPAPETTRLRLFKWPSLCVAPQFLAEELLRNEGFSDIQYIGAPSGAGPEKLLASGEIDINSQYSAPLIVRIDGGEPVVFLAGLHVGCFELFGTERVRTIRDLKNKTVGVAALGSVAHIFVSTIAAHVGLDPRRDLNFVTPPPAEAKRLLAAGKIDAYLGFPPDPLELRAQNVGHVLLNGAVDRPWSQYFCCMVAGNREFVRKHPIATKRALRALIKAVNLCALEPEQAARFVVDKGFADWVAKPATVRYDYAFQTMKNLPYGRWREYDPEDTLRFYALRLHEAGMITASPQKILAQGADWRFLNELKKELKG